MGRGIRGFVTRDGSVYSLCMRAFMSASACLSACVTIYIMIAVVCDVGGTNAVQVTQI